MTIEPGPAVAAALLALAALALAAHTAAGYGLTGRVGLGAVRACAQLGIAALVIRAAVESLVASVALVAVMFGVAVATTSRRAGAPRAWAWCAVAMASGLLPVLAVILASGSVPPEGIALIPIAGIVIGGTMTANTLMCRRVFDALREERAQYEAALALGMRPADAIRESAHRRAPEALIPGLDQVSTAGLVTLPGAYIGVLLGGGSPFEAAAAQLLVLFGLMAAQAITVAVGERLIERRALLPTDLRAALPD